MASQSDYLEAASEIYTQIEQLDSDYNEARTALKESLAKTIEEGRFETDLSVKDFADELGVKRQTVNRILISVFGIRHPDKAAAAALGHNA